MPSTSSGNILLSERGRINIISAIFAFLILPFFFSFLPFPTHAQTNPSCFTKEECAATPYNGRESKNVASECAGEAVGRKFYCYAPEPLICPPGVETENCKVKLAVSIGGQNISGLGNYIAAVYSFLLSIAGILAGIMITVAGFEWLLAAGSSEKITHAKKRIQNAIIGMVLALGSYVILQTVNPALTTLSLPPVKLTRRIESAERGFCNFKNLPANILEKIRKGEAPFAALACGGTFNCQDLPDACGGTSTGTCIGAWCATANLSCESIRSEKFSGTAPKEAISNLQNAMACVNMGKCNNCESIITLHTPLDSKPSELWTCAACSKCIIFDTVPGNFSCRKLIKDDPCSEDSDCPQGNICAPSIHLCRVPRDEGGTCGGSDGDCKKGLVCNKEETIDTCRKLFSLPSCAECDRGNLCQSGICGTDGECAGKKGETYSTDGDKDGEYCD